MISICYDGEKKSDLETLTRAVLDYVREEKKSSGRKKKVLGNFQETKDFGFLVKYGCKGIDGREPPGVEPA